MKLPYHPQRPEPGETYANRGIAASIASAIAHYGPARDLTYAGSSAAAPSLTAQVQSLFTTYSAVGGMWDFSDTSTMWQDSAGTTPVTATSQPVGRVLDISGQGNRLQQPTAANRVQTSARVNLLTKTEDFADAAWNKQSCTVAATTDPLGGNNAFTATLTGVTAALIQINAVPAMTNGKVLVAFKAGTLTSADITVYQGAAQATAVQIISGPGTASMHIGHGRITGLSSSEFTVVEVTVTTTAVGSLYIYLPAVSSGVSTGTIIVAFPQVSYASSRYQRVNTATDYDSVGFPFYVQPDGVNDSFVTAANLNLTTCDKVVVGMGYRKVDDTTRVQAETSVDFSGNAGTFYLVNGPDATNQTSAARGSAVAARAGFGTARANEYGAHIARHSIPGDLSEIWWNGVKGTDSTADKGTGNFGTFPLYLFARAGTSLYSNTPTRRALVFGIPVAGPQMTDDDIEIIRLWLMEGSA